MKTRVVACATRFQEKAITSVGITAEAFYSKAPAPDDYWRGIILFGSNVASYKFALAQSLLELAPQSGTLLKMSDLAPVYAEHIALHLQSCDKQGTSAGSTFLDACRRFNAGALDANGLAETTVRMGFKNVVDAFHVVGGRALDQRFFVDERFANNGLRITDAFSALQVSVRGRDLQVEVESR